MKMEAVSDDSHDDGFYPGNVKQQSVPGADIKREHDKNLNANAKEKKKDSKHLSKTKMIKKKEKQPEKQMPPQKKALIQKPKQSSRVVQSRNQNRRKKETRLYDQAEKKADNILLEMKERNDADVESFKQGKKALKRIKYLETLKSWLKNVYIAQRFLQFDGLEMFEIWLNKMPDKNDSLVEPALTIKMAVVQILQSLPVRNQHIIKAGELQRYLRKYLKSTFYQLCNASMRILKKWKLISCKSMIS